MEVYSEWTGIIFYEVAMELNNAGTSKKMSRHFQ